MDTILIALNVYFVMKFKKINYDSDLIGRVNLSRFFGSMYY